MTTNTAPVAPPPADSRHYRRAIVDHLRVVGLLASLAAAAVALVEVPPHGGLPSNEQWWWLLASFLLAAAAQFRLHFEVAEPPVQPRGVSRRRMGAGVAVAGAMLWLVATHGFYSDWYGWFDRAWIGWLAGTALLACGLDVAMGWSLRIGRLFRPLWLLPVAALIGAGAAWVRLDGIGEFPGPAGITQIEDLQFGHWGAQFLDGERRRWEFIGHAWISAVSIAVGGPSLESMRTGYAIVGSLTVVAVLAWLRAAAGMAAAVAGAAFMAVSSWDAVVARIGFNPDVLPVAVLYAILIGPARRGRPSAYAIMGLLSGYLLWEYIAYRPAIAIAAIGAVWLSLRDRSAGWALRVGRPALMLALVGMMAVPLFGARMHGRVWEEYFNGLNRARAQKHYYNEEYDWRQIVQLRAERVLDTVGLLYFLGDASPARNLGRRPLVDPVSATLMLVGLAGCLVNPAVSLFGLFAVGFALTAFGAMVVTADFNALRLSVTIPYLYFFVGVAALSLLVAMRRAWGRLGWWLATLLLAAGLAWAARASVEFLAAYRGSPVVRKVARNNLAYLSNWLRENVDEVEQVVGVGGKSYNALIGNDAAWLRGRPIPGVLEWDVMTALRAWKQDWPTMFLVFAGRDTRDTARYVEWLLPEAQFTWIGDPEGFGADLAYTRFGGRPAELDAALEYAPCRGVRVEYRFLGEKPGEVRRVIQRVEPLIGLGTWPSEVVAAFYGGYWPRRLEVTYQAEFQVARPGMYLIEGDFYGAEPRIEVDAQSFARSRRVHLEAGAHAFRATADFAPLPEGLVARLLWNGPDSGNEKELIPFYAVAVPSDDCTGGDRGH